ncbi:MAG: YhfC family intramembrane metalloprotease [Oscillospiraceae bacterium]|nr:YhfC family intramembrane metalloprotease [Oscillospiraceae bacterium]
MVTTATLVWLAIGAVFSFALPIGLLIWWRKTRKAKLAPFFVGALIWFVFAGTLEPLLHSAALLGDHALARAIAGSPYLYMLYGGLAAGIFEETGRYVAFRWLIGKRRNPERDTAVTYGIGHGGIEAMLTLGATYATMIVVALFLRRGDQSAALAMMGAETMSTYLAALGQLTPGTALLAMFERAGAMILHIALSIFVFLAARDRTQWTWFPFAIALHAIADMPAALYQRGMLPLAAVEIWTWVVALYALRSARKQYLEAMDP